jgi:hypothetical protein
MLMRHGRAGLPLMRTRVGSGLRQPGLMASAREALTRIKGLLSRILMTALKFIIMAILSPEGVPRAGPFVWICEAGSFERHAFTDPSPLIYGS